MILYCGVGVARVGHRLAHAHQRVLDGGGLLLLARGGEARRHVRVVAAVVLPPRRRGRPVGHAALDDRAEAVVVGADHHDDGLDVARGGLLAEPQRLALAAGRVEVEVDAGLEVLARARAGRARARARAGEVEAGDAAADVRLRGLGAVAAPDRLARRGVPVGGRAERVDVRGGVVGVARPAAGLAGDRRVAEGHHRRRAHPGAVGQRRWGESEHHTADDQDRAHRPHVLPLLRWLRAILPPAVGAVNRRGPAPG